MGDDYDWLFNDYAYAVNRWFGTNFDKREDEMWLYREDYDTTVKVAEATLNALEKGITFEALLKRNSSVRVFYKNMKTREETAAKEKLREDARKQKAAEAKAAKEAAKAEIMSRMTQEELEAFGLSNTTRSKK